MTKEEEAEKRDKELLAKNKVKIEGIIQLIMDGESRDSAADKVGRIRQAMGDNSDTEDDGQHQSKKGGMVFHPYKGKRVAITSRASKMLELGDALELQVQTKMHGEDLLRALHNAASTRVKILERQLARGVQG